MTAKRLSQYPYLAPKIKRLKGEIARLRRLPGNALAGHEVPPWDLREGSSGAVDEIQQKEGELAQAVAELTALEGYIAAIPHTDLREMFVRRFQYGETYAEVSAQFGYAQSPESVRKKIARYF